MRKGMDVPAVRKSGEEFHASIALSPVETTEGLQAVATVRDLTESMALRTEVGHARAQLDTMPESIVLLDSDGRLTYVNEEWRRDARRVGAPTAHITGVGLTYLDVARLPDSHSQQIMDGLSDVLAGRSAHFAAVYPCHEPDDLRWCRFVARAVDSDHGAALVTRVDCSEAHLATARSRVQDAIARSLATGLSLPDICSHLVDAVLVELGWQVGAVWVPEVSGTEQALQRTLLRVAPEAAAIDVETTPQPGPLAPGVGLPGRVWASLRPEWAADIATPAHLPDQAPLPAVRLRTGFAFPLLIESETLAVVEFYSDHPRKRDDALLSVLASAGRQVGDIVRRRRAESVREATLEELHRVQERLDTVLKAAPASILMIDRDGSVEFASRPLLETPTDALVGLSWVEVFPAEHRDAAAAAFERVRRSGSSELFEAPLAAAHGAQLWFQNHLAPVKCGADVVGAVVVSQDISDKRRIESELATTQRLAAVGSLAAGVAHEINTPIQFVGDSITFLREAMLDIFRLIEQLRAVRQSVQVGTPSLETADSASRLEDEIDLDYLIDNMPAACDRSADGIHRVATIVRAMKEFAHAPGRDMAPADLNRAIGSTLTVAGNEYKLVADVVTDFGDLPLVTCHVSDINQVILNLIVNSAHAIQDVVGDSGRKGTISVQTRLDGDDVVVAVSDTGGGIPAHVLTRMFEPFFTTKEIGRGSGQGLAIAWTIVTDKHAGRIYCESELGIGTTVYVRLPVAGFSSVTRADSEAAGTGAAKL